MRAFSVDFVLDKLNIRHISTSGLVDADTLRDLVTLTFDLLTLVSGHTWRVM